MKDEIITFETAKLAKEKGFDLPVLKFINSIGVGDASKETTYYPHGDGVDEVGGPAKLNFNGKIYANETKNKL